MRRAIKAATGIVALLCAQVITTVADAPPQPTLEAAEATSFALRVAPPDRRLTMGFTGDVHTLRAVNYDARQRDGSYDYQPMFAEIAGLVSWFDVAICHLEQPMAAPGKPVIVEPPLLSSAPTLATAVAAAGYDRCSTASNHSLDGGVAGIDATLGALDAVGVGHAGTARSAQEAANVTFETHGVTVAHLSYSFSLGGIPLPSGQPWRANRTDTDVINAAARQARVAGADIVVLSLHWGSDGSSAVTSDQRSVANAVTAAGDIDLIVGHHAHVLQPISQVNGVWVVWGMGNILTDLPVSSRWPAASQDAAVIGVEFTLGADGAVEVGTPTVYPTWVDRSNGHVVRLATQQPDGGLSTKVRAAMVASFDRTRRLLGAHLAPGVV